MEFGTFLKQAPQTQTLRHWHKIRDFLNATELNDEFAVQSMDNMKDRAQCVPARSRLSCQQEAGGREGGGEEGGGHRPQLSLAEASWVDFTSPTYLWKARSSANPSLPPQASN